MDKNKILNLLDEILIAEKDKIYNLVENIKNELNEEFIYLKNLLNSQEWPNAVENFQICDENSEDEKTDRAESVIEILIDSPLKDKKFLDFGCGEGHMAKYASSQGAYLAAGYDILSPQNSQFVWEQKQQNLLLSTDFEKIKNEGPYDIIILYDVLDHSQDPVQVLKNAKSLLAEDGTIYLRCHPWCGRHGGHLYKQINKAFINLVFTEEEINQMGYKLDFSNKVFYPVMTYGGYIKDAGFTAGFAKNDPDIDFQNVENFFSENEIVKSRILRNFTSKKWSKDQPVWQMSQCFLDYKLK